MTVRPLLSCVHRQQWVGCDTVARPGPFCYVETLYLPAPGWRALECRPLRASSCAGRLASLAHLDYLHSRNFVMTVQDVDQLAWARWMLGHQAAFVTWRLISEALVEMLRSGWWQPEHMTRVRQLFEIHSILFMYAGSCSDAVYSKTIRPAMVRHHPAFTGRWARDRMSIPSLLRQLHLAGRGMRLGPIDEAVRLNHQVHRAVAKRLVPHGRSLWQKSGHNSDDESEMALRDGYDCFFATVRAPACADAVLAQYIRRLSQIRADLCLRGLYPKECPNPVSAFLQRSYRTLGERLEQEIETVICHTAVGLCEMRSMLLDGPS